MPEMEINVTMLKCPICDSNHNYRVKVEYAKNEGEEKTDSSTIYYNTFMTRKKVGDKVLDVEVFEIDAFCQKNGIPFRIIVDPLLPPETIPVKFSVSAAT